MSDLETMILPVLTLIMGNLLGYFFALRQTRRRITAEKRVEFASRLVALGYDNLGALLDSAVEPGLGVRKREFSLLGQQTAFFVSDAASQAIDDMTTHFAGAVMRRTDGHMQQASVPSESWQSYRSALEKVRSQLRKELQAGR